MYQLTGWGLFICINLFFALVFGKFNFELIARLSIFVGLGVIISHLMRYAIIRSHLLMKPVQHQLVGFLVMTFIFACILGYVEFLLTQVFGVNSRQEANMGVARTIISNIFVSSVYLFIWNCIYLLYHYIQRPRVAV